MQFTTQCLCMFVCVSCMLVVELEGKGEREGAVLVVELEGKGGREGAVLVVFSEVVYKVCTINYVLFLVKDLTSG